MLDESLRVLVVEARFHTEVADDLLRGAKAALTAADAQFDLISVPGALEIRLDHPSSLSDWFGRPRDYSPAPVRRR